VDKKSLGLRRIQGATMMDYLKIIRGGVTPKPAKDGLSLWAKVLLLRFGVARRLRASSTPHSSRLKAKQNSPGLMHDRFRSEF